MTPSAGLGCEVGVFVSSVCMERVLCSTGLCYTAFSGSFCATSALCLKLCPSHRLQHVPALQISKQQCHDFSQP